MANSFLLPGWGVGRLITLPSLFALRQIWPAALVSKIYMGVVCDTFTLRQQEGQVGPAGFSPSSLHKQRQRSIQTVELPSAWVPEWLYGVDHISSSIHCLVVKLARMWNLFVEPLRSEGCLLWQHNLACWSGEAGYVLVIVLKSQWCTIQWHRFVSGSHYMFSVGRQGDGLFLSQGFWYPRECRVHLNVCSVITTT